jgi:hypothetical protein
MSQLPNELAYNRYIWWDPGPDGPYGPHFPWQVQQQIAAVTLEARAQTLKIQGEAYAKIASIVAGAKEQQGNIR